MDPIFQPYKNRFISHWFLHLPGIIRNSIDHINSVTVFLDQPDKGTPDDDPVDIWGDLSNLLGCGYTKADHERQSGYPSYSFHIPFDVDNPRPRGPRDPRD